MARASHVSRPAFLSGRSTSRMSISGGIDITTPYDCDGLDTNLRVKNAS